MQFVFQVNISNFKSDTYLLFVIFYIIPVPLRMIAYPLRIYVCVLAYYLQHFKACGTEKFEKKRWSLLFFLRIKFSFHPHPCLIA